MKTRLCHCQRARTRGGDDMHVFRKMRLLGRVVLLIVLFALLMNLL